MRNKAMAILLMAGCSSQQVFFTPFEDALSVLEPELASATETIDVAMYTFTHETIAGYLIDAHLRGAKVRLLVDYGQSLPPAADGGGAVGQLDLVNNLEDEGITVCRRGGEDGGIMHHKFAVIDSERVITGSYNFTPSATERNLENLLVIADPAMAANYAAAFEEAWSCDEE